MLINFNKSREGPQDGQGWSLKPREERLQDQGSFSSKPRRLRGHLTVAPQLLRRGHSKDKARLFTKVCTDRQ